MLPHGGRRCVQNVSIWIRILSWSSPVHHQLRHDIKVRLRECNWNCWGYFYRLVTGKKCKCKACPWFKSLRESTRTKPLILCRTGAMGATDAWAIILENLEETGRKMSKKKGTLYSRNIMAQHDNGRLKSSWIWKKKLSLKASLLSCVQTSSRLHI